MRRLFQRLLSLMRRRTTNEELDEEVRFHLDHLEARYRDQGTTPEEAAKRARLQFGHVVALKEQVHDVVFGRWAIDGLQDARVACRMLARQPLFTCVVIGAIAVAIAANTSIFSVVRAVLLQPLPYRDPSRLVVIWDRDSKQKGSKLLAQYRDFDNWRAHSVSFERIAGATWAVPNPVATGIGPARSVLAVPATVELFPALGVTPVLGRVFDRGDLQGGCSVVLAHRYWRDVAGSPTDLASLHLALDDRTCTVVGVMPPQFAFFPEPTEMWVLILPTDPIARLADAVGGLGVFGRLAPHVTLAAAQAELQTLSRQIDRGVRYGTDMEPVVYPLQQEFTFLAGSNLRLSLLLLSAAVVALLLIACVNVASLLLGRAQARQRELAIRAAIGSGRGRLVRQLLTESLMLSVLAAAIGVLLAAAAVRVFNVLAPVQLPVGASVEIDVSVILFAAGLVVITTVLFGLWPAWKTSRLDLPSSLLSASGGGSTRRIPRLVRNLVIAEIGLSFVLLSSGALLVKSAVRFSNESLGFEPDGLVFETIHLPPAGYATVPQRAAFFDRALQTLGADRDVDESAFSTALPLRGGQGVAALVIDGRPAPVPGSVVPDVSGQLVTPSYFHLMNVALEQGRPFSSRDQRGSEPVGILNAAAASKYFPSGDAVGRRVQFYGSPKSPWVTVVGVVTNEKRHGPNEEMGWTDAPILYRPLPQNPPSVANAIIRLRGQGAGQGAAIQRELRSLDANVVVGDIETARQLRDRYLAYPQFRATLLGVFAAVAFVLALVGLYGVLSQVVGQRKREVGVRMAIGAMPRDVLMLIAREGVWMMTFGVVGGLVATLWLSSVVASVLFGLTGHDGPTLSLVVVALSVTSLAAILIPAVRAAKTDPLIAIRQE